MVKRSRVQIYFCPDSDLNFLFPQLKRIPNFCIEEKPRKGFHPLPRKLKSDFSQNPPEIYAWNKGKKSRADIQVKRYLELLLNRC
jgi:hypothetical protein